MRVDNRRADELRKISIVANVLHYAEGSCEVRFGGTRVLCAASLEENVPPFLRDTGKGWVTAEYNMLPRATQTRNRRERKGAKGRTVEIERLIARSLRAVIDLEKLGERSITVDCDVIEADGGTRTASITGAYVALSLAIKKMLAEKLLSENPLIDSVCAVSVGILAENVAVLDLNYHEDSRAKVDMNLVMTGKGAFVEIQGTGEEATFTLPELHEMLTLGSKGISELTTLQKQALTDISEESVKKVPKKMIVIATKNKGKAKEFEAMFAEKGYQVRTLLDYPEIKDVEETGETFEENARLKAETIARILGVPVLADDSGLVVEALHGMPGVYSARYSDVVGIRKATDHSNIAKLLSELHQEFAKEGKPRASFHCTLVLAAPNKESLVVEADWQGAITPIPKGENGFGYDPIFWVEELGKTSAELESVEKNQHSHRAKALAKLQLVWEEWMGEVL